LNIFCNENRQVPFEVKWFEMDETELICVCVFPDSGDRIIVIDFLSNPSIKETERKTPSRPLSNGHRTSWSFTVAKEIHKTLTSFNDV
jgi:hypothetical protein